VQHLARRVAPVDAAAHQARLEAGEQVLVDLEMLVAQDGRHLALFEAEPLQAGRQAVRAGVQLLPGEAALAVVVGDFVRVMRRAAGKIITWQHGCRLLLQAGGDRCGEVRPARI
jgi:hypothetical protein